MKDEDFDDQTSTRIRMHDSARVLESGKSVIMIAWRAGMWRRNLKVFLVIAVIIVGIFLWKNHNKTAVTAPAENAATQQTGTTGASDINYQVVGRGLVYSCSNKSFYCIDKDDYYKCRASMKAGKSDCITRGVLESTSQCLQEAKGKKATAIKCP